MAANRPRPPSMNVEGKLDGMNYPLWKFKAMAILSSYELYEMVLGNDIEPTPTTDASGATIPPDPVKVLEWQRRNADALSFLVTSVEDSILTMISHVKEASKAWMILKNQYETTNPTRVLNLENQLQAERMSEGETVEQFLTRIKGLRDQMGTVGIIVDTKDLARRCLRILPLKFEGFVTALTTAQRPTPLTFEEFSSLLQDEELRLKTRNGGDSAFTASTKGKGKGKESGNSSDSRKKKMKCFYCNKKGHLAKECRKKQADIKNGTLKSGETTNAAKIATVEAPKLPKIDLFIAIEEETQESAHVSTHDESWIIDSGATRHMTCRKDWYSSLRPMGEDAKVAVGNNAKCPIKGIGTISFLSQEGSSKQLSDVLWVPDLSRNLLSVAGITDKDMRVVFDKHGALILDCNDSIIARGTRRNNLYEFCAYATQADVGTSKLWHERFGHVSITTLQDMQKGGLVVDLPALTDSQDVCEACMKGKQHRHPFPKEGGSRAKSPLQLVHADLCGKMQTMALGGSFYFFTLIDDYSRKIWVYFLKEKSHAFGKFKEWHAMVEAETGAKLIKFRTDGGGEFVSNENNAYYKEHGIQRQITNAHTPQQNGVAERKNRVIVEMARSMLQGSSLPNSFWAEAVNTAVYILNRCATKAVKDKTPLEAYSGIKPSVAHFKVFGCECYAHVPKENRRKLDPKSRKCIFLGYDMETKGYRLYDPQAKEVLVSRDVVFQECKRQEEEVPSSSSKEITIQRPQPQAASWPASGTQEQWQPTSHPHEEDSEDDDKPATPQKVKPLPRWMLQLLKDSDSPVIEEGPSSVRRSKRLEEQKAQVNLVNYALMSQVLSVQEPSTLEEAQKDPKWVEAMQIEYDSIMKNRTWSLVDRPLKRKVIGTKWIYKLKYKADGTMEKYKARLVVKGFAQVEGFDFQETFAPTAKMTTIRLVLALAAHEQWPVYQMDVKSAFLNGNLEEEVYIEQPPGFVVLGKEDKVCRLHKALYGLKQAPRAWYHRIDSFFVSANLSRSPSDANLYFFCEKNLYMVIILYVDDLIITGSHEQRIVQTQELLCQEFEMTNLGLMHYCLGIEVWQKPKGIFISQQKYAREILKTFGMTDCKSVTTPMEVGLKLSTEDISQPVDETLFRKLVGSLIYLCNTRPDINFAVGVISRFANNPRTNHWNAGMRILRYICGTMDYGITYDVGNTLIGFCDSDWAGDADTRRSVTGFCFCLGSGCVSWSSKKQPTVALSSTEAEYKAACLASCEALWLRRVLMDLGAPQIDPTMVQCDNQSCMAIAKNPVFHARTKHIEIQYHYVRELILNESIDLVYCHTSENCADIFTKALSREQLEHHLHRLGIGTPK